MSELQCPHCDEFFHSVGDAFCPICRESLDEEIDTASLNASWTTEADGLENADSGLQQQRDGDPENLEIADPIEPHDHLLNRDNLSATIDLDRLVSAASQQYSLFDRRKSWVRGSFGKPSSRACSPRRACVLHISRQEQ